VTGAIVRVDEQGFELNQRTRFPSKPIYITFDEVSSVERREPGITSGAKASIAVGAVLAGYLILVASILAHLD
jgi:hypothetical protein